MATRMPRGLIPQAGIVRAQFCPAKSPSAEFLLRARRRGKGKSASSAVVKSSRVLLLFCACLHSLLSLCIGSCPDLHAVYSNVLAATLWQPRTYNPFSASGCPFLYGWGGFQRVIALSVGKQLPLLLHLFLRTKLAVEWTSTNRLIV